MLRHRNGTKVAERRIVVSQHRSRTGRKSGITRVLAIFVFGLFTSIAAARSAEPLTVAQLLADGARYDNKVVRVVGFLHLDFEDSALYDGKETDLNFGRGPHIWVDTEHADAPPDKYSRKSVLLEGTFVFGPSGHMGVFPGQISNITRIDILPPERQ